MRSLSPVTKKVDMLIPSNLHPVQMLHLFCHVLRDLFLFRLNLTLFSSSSLSLTDRSSRMFWYRSLWLWKSFCARSSLGRLVASRGLRFSSSRSTRYASYSIL